MMKSKIARPGRFLFLLIAVALIVGVCVIFYHFRTQPSGNGSPALVYKEFNRATKTGDFSIIRRFISREHQPLFDKMSDRQKADNGKFIKGNAPTRFRITKEEINGDTAVIYLDGNARNFFNGGIAPYGKVIFHREDGRWKIFKEHWADRKENLK